MPARLRPRLTYANVVSTLCLFILLGGSAVAASGLLTGKDIKNRSVPGKKLKKHTITGAEVKLSALGTVANASHAGNSDLLRGKRPADFASAKKVLTSGWKTASSCGNGCAHTVKLLDNGTFDLVAGCEGNTSGSAAHVFLKTDGTSVQYVEGFSGFEEGPNTPAQFFTGAQTTGLSPSGVSFDLLASHGAPLSGQATLIPNIPSAGQCAFNASAISG
jgi:hypothetical protein